ncbi:MAG: tetracycline resistance MFS efflux pump, partial [Gemmatimonadota bacterium]
MRSPHALTFVLITVLIDTIGLGIVIPVLPELVMQLTGEGLSAASRWGGWLAFAYAGMQVV